MSTPLAKRARCKSVLAVRWSSAAVSIALACCGETPPKPTDGPHPADTDVSAGPSVSASLSDGGLLFDQCAAVAVEANEVPVNMLFILDASGSMNCVPPNGDAAEAKLCKTDPRKRGNGPSKWQVTRDALTGALAPLVGRANLNVAVSPFPLSGTRCDVAPEPEIAFAALDDQHLDRFAELLADRQPDGETPVAGATILGYAAVSEGLRNGTIRGNASIVLLTDGEETCKPSELGKLIAHDAPLARDGFGIRTFVIAAPGSEDANLLLSQLANAGGTNSSPDCNHLDNERPPDCHFDMTRSTNFERDLGAVLEEITRTKALTCEFDVPRNPEGGALDLSKVNVTLVAAGDAGGERAPIGKHEASDGTCQDKQSGWTYSSDRSRILVCGQDCETVKRSVHAQVQIVLGCRSLSRDDVR